MLPTAAVPMAAPAPVGEELESSGHQAHIASLVPGIRWGLLALAVFLAVVRGPAWPTPSPGVPCSSPSPHG